MHRQLSAHFSRAFAIRSFLAASLLALLGSSIGRAEEPKAATNEHPSSVLRSALDTRIDIDLKEASLQELVELVRKQVSIPVLIDRKSLEDAAISVDAPITLSLHRQPLRSVLALALSPLELTTTVNHGVLVITTKEQYASQLEVHTYNVGDLKSDLRKSIFGGATAYRELAELITTVLQPNTWDEVGGPGNLAQFGDVLTINQTSDVHEQLEELLAGVRMARGVQAKGTVVDVVDYPVGRADEKRRMDQRVSFNFQEVSLLDVCHKIGEMIKMDVVLDRKALEDAAISSDSPITLKLENVRLKDALFHLLKPLELTAMFRGGVLLITTLEKSAAELITQIYPVADLADFASDTTGIGPDELADTILTTIEPNTWDEVGGPGSIFALSPAKCLVISQTNECHDVIRGLLKQIRATRSAEAAAGNQKSEDGMVLRIYAPEASAEKPSSGDGNSKESASSPAMSQLIAAVQEVVEPDSWNENGASIRQVGVALIVRQRESVHEQITELLEQFHFRPVSKRTFYSNGGMSSDGSTRAGGGFF